MAAFVPTWINIPSFAQPGQPHAFADREEQIAQLYLGLVSAGNAVRAGMTGVRHRVVVLGPKGVGKSALVLQALGMVRDELAVAAGQHLALPPDLPEPVDRQRWLVLRLSGKSVAVENIPEAIERSMIGLLDDAGEEIQRKVPSALDLPLLDRLFRTREAALFAQVRSAMLTLTKTIDFVRFFQGSSQADKIERITQTSSSAEASASLEAQLKAQGAEPTTTEAKAAVKAAAGLLRKAGSTVTSSVERKRTVDAEWITDALNDFFAATDAAGLPTILFLDDFDELASSAGPEHAARAAVLHSVLGSFGRLAPTCLVIALRSEYMMEDINRAYEIVDVPPMTRLAGGQALAAWARVLDLPEPAGQALLALGDRFLQALDHDQPVVNPFRFLQLVASSARARADRKPYDLVLDHLTRQGSYEIRRIAEGIAGAMPQADILLCAASAPLAPAPYDLQERDRRTLVQYGLLRPAMAGDANDPRFVLDPLFAYLRAASPGLPAGPPAPKP